MKILSDPRRISNTGRVSIAALTLTGAGLLLSGCPGGAELENADAIYEQVPFDSGPPGDGDAPPMVSYCKALPIFEANCGLGSSCHIGDADGPPDGGVDLVTGDVGAGMLDVAATYPGLDCGSGELLVNSASIDDSLILKKLNDTHTCGSVMPIGPALPARDLECVRNWIEGLIAEGGSSGSGGASMGTGGDAGTGGDMMGTGGDMMGTGGDTMGTGGDMMGTGGSPPAGGPVVIEAECAFDQGCTDGVTGSYVMAGDGPQVEDGGSTSTPTVGYMEDGVTLTYSDIPAGTYDTITVSYAMDAAGGGSLEIYQDSASGTLLGTFSPTSTGGWSMWSDATVTLDTPLTGGGALVVVARPTDTYLCNLDTIELSAGSAQ